MKSAGDWILLFVGVPLSLALAIAALAWLGLE